MDLPTGVADAARPAAPETTAQTDDGGDDEPWVDMDADAPDGTGG